MFEHYNTVICSLLSIQDYEIRRKWDSEDGVQSSVVYDLNLKNECAMKRLLQYHDTLQTQPTNRSKRALIIYIQT